MNEKVVKYQRKIVKKYVNALLSNMNIWNRIVFIFTGNYWKPMLRTDHKLYGKRD